MPFKPQHGPNEIFGLSVDNLVSKHAIELLARRRMNAEGQIHIDVGAGLGGAAGALTERLGLQYIAFDLDSDGRMSQSLQGFELHRLTLGDEEAVYDSLVRIIADRVIASISIINVLSDIDATAPFMRAINRVAAMHGALIVISVTNDNRLNSGLRAFFGWRDDVQSGLPGHRFRRLFSAASLNCMLANNGLHVIDSNDLSIIADERVTASDHPALLPATYLHKLLDSLRKYSDEFGSTDQFIWLCKTNDISSIPSFQSINKGKRPFLSIVLRTQGTRLDALSETLLCLTAQSITDFEILIIGHKLDSSRRLGVETVIEDLPLWIRAKTRLIEVPEGNRTRPLNVGFSTAEGEHIVILDDDDIVFGHWIESFHTLSLPNIGQILRSASVVQSISRVEAEITPGIRSESSLELVFPTTFDWFEHLRVNHSPAMTLAFPRGLFHHLNVQFDESLSTMEDWDYLLRTSGLVGVASTPEITAVYRKWIGSENSFTVHETGEWTRNMDRIFEKIDASASVIWPIGSTRRLRRFLDDIGVLEERSTSILKTQEEISGLRDLLHQEQRHGAEAQGDLIKTQDEIVMLRGALQNEQQNWADLQDTLIRSRDEVCGLRQALQREQQQWAVAQEALILTQEEMMVLRQALQREQEHWTTAQDTLLETQKEVALLRQALQIEQQQWTAAQGALILAQEELVVLRQALQREQQQWATSQDMLLRTQEQVSGLQQALHQERQRLAAAHDALVQEQGNRAVLHQELCLEKQRFSTLEDSFHHEQQKRIILEGALAAEQQRITALKEASQIYHSARWRLAAPFRLFTRILGRSPVSRSDIWSLSTHELQKLTEQLRTKRSQ
jgi:nitrate reductase assembly molybdenum cofactor insertion protein NarJ